MQNFFQVPPNVFLGVPPNTPHSVSPDVCSIIIFVVFSVVLVVVFHNIFPVVFPDATSSFNFRDSSLIGNNIVYNSVNHIFVVCDYYIIINYFLNIIIPYLYNILYYIII